MGTQEQNIELNSNFELKLDVVFLRRFMGATQFEAIFARRTFPCFDEPDFKATFDLVVAHQNSLSAVSNMPLQSTEPLYVEPHSPHLITLIQNWISQVLRQGKGPQLPSFTDRTKKSLKKGIFMEWCSNAGIFFD